MRFSRRMWFARGTRYMGEENAISCFSTLDTISWFLPSPMSVDDSVVRAEAMTNNTSMQVEEISLLHVTPGSTISAQLISRHRVIYSVESKDFYQLLSGMIAACGLRWRTRWALMRKTHG